MATVHNKYEQQLLNDFIEYLNNGIIPWEQNWLKKEAINVATGREYNGINAFILNVCANKNHYSDCNWININDIEKKEYVLNTKLPPLANVWSKYNYFTVDEKGKWLNKITEQEYYEKRKINYKSVVQVPSTYQLVNMECVQNRLPKQERDLDDYMNENQKVSLINQLINNYLTKEKITIEPSDTPSYNPLYKKIKLPDVKSFSNLQEYQNLLLHFICHHEVMKNIEQNDSDLEKNHVPQIGTNEYAQEELKIDLVQFYLFKQLNLDFVEQTKDSNKEYIPLWKIQLENKPYDFINYLKTARLKIVPQILKSMDYEINQLLSQPDDYISVQCDNEYYIFNYETIKNMDLKLSNEKIEIKGNEVELYYPTNSADKEEIRKLAKIYKKETHYMPNSNHFDDQEFNLNDDDLQF